MMAGRALSEVDPDDYRDLPGLGPVYAERLWRFYAAKSDRLTS